MISNGYHELYTQAIAIERYAQSSVFPLIQRLEFQLPCLDRLSMYPQAHKARHSYSKEGVLLRNVSAAPICDPFAVVPPNSWIREPVPFLV